MLLYLLFCWSFVKSVCMGSLVIDSLHKFKEGNWCVFLHTSFFYSGSILSCIILSYPPCLCADMCEDAWKNNVCIVQGSLLFSWLLSKTRVFVCVRRKFAVSWIVLGLLEGHRCCTLITDFIINLNVILLFSSERPINLLHFKRTRNFQKSRLLVPARNVVLISGILHDFKVYMRWDLFSVGLLNMVVEDWIGQ